jgi:acetoin utilization protein AcuB
MSKHPLTIKEDEPISEAHEYMHDQQVRHLPVVNRAGDMVGLVTEDDLLKAQPSSATSLSVWEIHYLISRIKVKDVMVRDVISTTEDTPIEEAARVMAERKISCLPVLRDGKLVGIITETDIFRFFTEMFDIRHKGVRITMETLDRAGELAKIGKAVAEQAGYIAASGVFVADDPTKAGVILKVRNVDSKTLTDALSQIEGIKLLDVREV